MRAVAVDEDALVVTSSVWMTTATALRTGGEAFLIDSPYFPDELDALPSLLSRAGFEPVGLLATHADFDHLLAPLAFPGVPLAVGESSALRLRAEPGGAQRALREADAHHYVRRERPLALGSLQQLPVPGKLEIGGSELELHPAVGHAADGLAFFWRERKILICGDYLSDVEIPTIHSLDDYRSTLALLATLVRAATTVIPGHGSVLGRDAALRILDEDIDYLDGLEAGREALPQGRRTARQRELHGENAVRLAT